MVNKDKLINSLAVVMSVLAAGLTVATVVTGIDAVSYDGSSSSKANVTIINTEKSNSIDEEILNESVGNQAYIDTEESLIDLYNKFYSINNDVSAYLRIRDSNLNLPIVQQKEVCYEHHVVDNCFYLYRDIYKRSAVNTNAIQFIEANNNVGQTIDEFDQTTIIYGHTWNNLERNGEEARIGDPNDKQFDQLVSYTSMDWLNTHRVLELTTGQEITYWVPQYVVYTDAVKSTNPDGFNYGKRTLTEDDLKILYDRSVIISTESVDILSDKLLILSTCNSKYGNNGSNRLVVVFKYIDANDYNEATEIANSITYEPHENIVDWN